MKDDDGNYLKTIGYDTWMATISIAQVTAAGKQGPAIEGQTYSEFLHGDGKAVFDNVIVTGDMESVQFSFSITHPTDHTVLPVLSNVISLLPAIKRGPCDKIEGSPFDKKESWAASCDYVCQSSCVDLSGLVSLPPVCKIAASCDGKS